MSCHKTQGSWNGCYGLWLPTASKLFGIRKCNGIGVNHISSFTRRWMVFWNAGPCSARAEEENTLSHLRAWCQPQSLPPGSGWGRRKEGTKRPFQSQPTLLVTTESPRWESRRLQEQTNSMLVLLLTQASSTLSSSPSRGALPCLGGSGGAEGCPSCPHAHTHTALGAGEQRAAGKHSLAPSCFLYAATLHTAPGRILPPLLLLKLLQQVVLLLYTAACFWALHVVRLQRQQYRNWGNICHPWKMAKIF